MKKKLFAEKLRDLIDSEIDDGTELKVIMADLDFVKFALQLSLAEVNREDKFRERN